VAVVLLPVLNEFVGKPHNDRIVRVGCATALVVIASCACCVLLAALMIRLRRPPGEARRFEMVVGVPFRARGSTVLPSWFPLVQVDAAWEVDGDVAVEASADREGGLEIVTARRRGEFNNLVRRYHITDVLGLTRWVVRRKSEDSAIIRPAPGPAIPWTTQETESADLDANSTGAPQGDLIESRRYAAGDPLRLILWKVYARSGEVLIRSPERTAAPRRKAMAYFVVGDRDEPTARVACGLLESGSLGDAVWFKCDGGEHPVQTPQQAIDQIVRSANAVADNEAELTSFLQSGARLGLTNCTLFVPSTAGAWLNRVATAAASFPGTLRLVMGAEVGDEPTETPSRWRRLFTHSVRKASDTSWKTTVERLLPHGLRPAVFDPRTGVEITSN
jgi:hypothetical protein